MRRVGLCFVFLLSRLPNSVAEAPEKTLLELAEVHFPESTPDALWPQERDFIEAVQRGEGYSPKAYDANRPSHRPWNAKNWRRYCHIRAAVIRWICTDREAQSFVPQFGVVAAGVYVDGPLNLILAQVPFSLSLFSCYVSGDLILMSASLRGVHLQGSWVDSLSAEGLKCESNVFISDGFRAERTVRLTGATIGGNVLCSSGTITGVDGVALIAERAIVNGSLLLSDGFRAHGEVLLSGATIGGSLNCDGGVFTNPNGVALNAVNIDVKDAITLGSGFLAEGKVLLSGATIGSTLYCSNGTIKNPNGNALTAAFMKSRNVLLSEKFSADGSLEFVMANVSDSFVIANLPNIQEINLSFAGVSTLVDDTTWPGTMLLNGFTYKMLATDWSGAVERRLHWIRRSTPFSTQPYEELAGYYHEQGRIDDAKTILIAKEDDRLKQPEVSLFAKAWGCVLKWVIAYGYKPWRAFWYVVGFILFGWWTFRRAWNDGIITPAGDNAYRKDKDGKVIRGQYDELYPTFNAFLYSLNTFAPLVDLRQDKYWIPNPNRGRLLISIDGRKIRWGSVYRLYMCVHILAGWGLMTMLIAGFTGLVQH